MSVFMVPFDCPERGCNKEHLLGSLPANIRLDIGRRFLAALLDQRFR